MERRKVWGVEELKGEGGRTLIGWIQDGVGVQEVYEEMGGVQQDISDVRHLEDPPSEARRCSRRGG